MTVSAVPTILHVDDDRGTRESLGWVLDAEGFRVAEAATGADALRLARQGPDLILLDVQLPDLSGFEVCQALKADPVTAAIPIVQISGHYVRGEDRARGLERGADAYLTKPVEPRELVAHIRALLRVRRAEQAFRSLADNVPDVIARFDRDLRHVFVNRRIEPVTGQPAEAFLGKTNRELGMPAALVARWEKVLREVFATGRETSIEFEYPTPAGPRHFETRLVPEFAPGGAVQTVLGVNRDVTEQRRSEESLRRSEERFRRYFQLGLVGMAITSPTKSILEVNDACCRILGYGRNELLAISWAELTHPDDLAADVAEFERVLAGEIDGYTMDKRFVRKDGRVIDATISVRCLRDPQGSVELFLALLQDVTAQRRAEALLREREERYRVISELTSDYIYSTAIHPDGRLETEWVTGAFRAITGYTAAEVNALGGWPAVIDPDDQARAREFGRAIAANRPGVLEYRIVTKGRETRWLRDHARPEWDAGQQRVVRVLGAVEDVTSRKRAEVERERLHQEVVANRGLLEVLSRRLIEAQEEERRHLARELHDEIGQVFTTVHLMLQSLKPHVDRTAWPRLHEGVQVVNQAIEQVREMSLDLRPAALDLLGLETALRGYLGRQAERAGLALDFTSSLGERPLPSALETACFRVVQEALTNVLRHARAEHCRVELALLGPEVQLTVRDDGIGFDMAAVRQRGLRGEGFGLLSMHERVQLFGGQMDLDSAPGRGTTIRVRFPLTEVHEGGQS